MTEVAVVRRCMIGIWFAAASLPPVLRAQDASIRGRVLADSTQQPIRDAKSSLGNGEYAAQSDSLGRYRITGVRAGRYAVLVRRLGFAPLSTTVTVASDDSVDVDFALAPLAQELAELDVTASVTSRKLRDFYDRKRFGIGRFMTEDDIRKAPGSRMSEKVRGLPGLMLMYPRSGSSSDVRIGSTRGQQSIMLQGSGPCPAAIMLDGLQMTQPFSVNSLDPNEIAAIEWYSGPAQMPAEFNSTRNTCGLMVIWTK